MQLARINPGRPTHDLAPSALGECRAEPQLTAGVGLPVVPHRYRSILVPVDGEAFGEHALSLALGIARRGGATVRVAYVHRPFLPAGQPGLYPEAGPLDAKLRRRGRAYLADLVRRLAKTSTTPVLPVFLEGDDIAETLCAEAADATDLVVMATHGRGPLGRLWWGSVGDELLRRLSLPLLLVRGFDTPADLTGDPVLRRVVVPLDGTPFAEQILEPALALGSLQDADHTLLRVVSPPRDYSVGDPQRRLASRPQAEEWRYLRAMTDRLGERGARVRPCLVSGDLPAAEAILQHARAHDADLIALATHGRGGLSRLFRGSVADRVVRGASVPVLVYRPKQNE